MPNDANAIPVAANGKVYVTAYTGSETLPTDSTTAMNAAFTEVGYISEDGVSFSFATEQEGIPAWQSLYPVRTVVTGTELEASFSMLEWNEDSLKLAFGGGTWTDNADDTYDFEPPLAGEGSDFAVVIDATDGTKSYRIVLPRVSVTGLGDITFVRGEASALEVTLSGLADSTGQALYIYYATPSA